MTDHLLLMDASLLQEIFSKKTLRRINLRKVKIAIPNAENLNLDQAVDYCHIEHLGFIGTVGLNINHYKALATKCSGLKSFCLNDVDTDDIKELSRKPQLKLATLKELIDSFATLTNLKSFEVALDKLLDGKKICPASKLKPYLNTKMQHLPLVSIATEKFHLVKELNKPAYIRDQTDRLASMMALMAMAVDQSDDSDDSDYEEDWTYGLGFQSGVYSRREYKELAAQIEAMHYY